MRRIAHHGGDVSVWRNGAWLQIDSVALVPGDVVEVRADMVAPCDGLLISGYCLVDESSLTGESLPLQKTAAPNQTEVCVPCSVLS